MDPCGISGAHSARVLLPPLGLWLNATDWRLHLTQAQRHTCCSLHRPPAAAGSQTRSMRQNVVPGRAIGGTWADGGAPISGAQMPMHEGLISRAEPHTASIRPETH